MRIFALEYATGGGILERPALAACRTEGEAMLCALVTDLAAVHGVTVATVLDASASASCAAAAAQVRRVREHAMVRPLWEELMRDTDAVWPVAPETDSILADLAKQATATGRVLLGSRRGAVEIAGSKLRTAALLARHGVAVVPTFAADDAPASADRGDGWVAKPDDGVGGDGASWFASLGEARRRAEGRAGMVLQPFLAGTPISLSLLAQDGEAWILACNVQDVVCERGDFAYRGFRVGAAEPLRTALEPIAAAVVAALPGLWGYVGIDLVAAAEGPIVLEVNPRLTTSYIGLSRSIGANPASLVLKLLDRPLAALRRPLKPRPVTVALETAA